MGEVFAGRYELVDPIGRGGVGAVWRAWDHRRRRYVAAKVLQQSDAHSLLRFVREQALRIDHPHVLAPASWAADDDKVLFTMDLVAGGSLVHLVGDYGPLPPAFVCTLLDQLLAGLAAVHAEGVVHRDIKPANILLEATGTARPRLRLSDFGIAMRLGEPRLTETNYVVGTPGYFAPESMLGAEPDFPADLFAVGLVALYLLQGAKPDAKALIEHFADHGTPSAPQGVPEPLWQIVAALLEPDPQARFRTATGARKALASIADLLPETGPDDEQIEIFDQLGPLPPAFGPDGPLTTVRQADGRTVSHDVATEAGTGGTLPDADPRSPESASRPAWPGGASPPAGPVLGAAPPPGPDPQSGSMSTDTDRAVPGMRTSSRTDTNVVSPADLPPDTGPGTVQPPTDGGTVHTGAGPQDEGPLRPISGSGPGEGLIGAPPTTSYDPPGPAPITEASDSAPAVDKPPTDPSGQDSPPGQPRTLSGTDSFRLPPPPWPAHPGPQKQHQPQPQRYPKQQNSPDQQHYPGPQNYPAHQNREGRQKYPEQPPTPPTATVLPAPAYGTVEFGITDSPAASTHVTSPHQHSAGSAAFASTASYTARVAEVPTPQQATARHRAKPPGPPAKVAVPVLLFALICFAVGFWALFRI
ncbi:serine/threonine protein kinase [Streptomyces cavernae]|uniref:serine/threonine protein kinase n=1 Tax=Streptomyces cavernae TaxID=2259034 RepID=UPI000FEBB210|nr:serine/threonine-protein kinase [Streptomyces cavernae]